MAPLWQDLRYACRTLRKSPLFTTVAVFSLALGIGANTAIFTLINQLILRLLPVQHPEELVLLTSRGSHYGSNTGSNAISYPMYQDFRDKNQVFSSMFCRLRNDHEPEHRGTHRAGVGRTGIGQLLPGAGRGGRDRAGIYGVGRSLPGCHPLAVLSYTFWKTRFAGDRGVIGGASC